MISSQDSTLKVILY